MSLSAQTDHPTRAPDAQPRQDGFELRFGSLFAEGRGLSFPCDAAGHVEPSALSQRARLNYLRAVAVVGREYGMPSVRRRDPC